MVKSSDRSAAEVKRVNQQLEERHYEFRSNCNDGEGASTDLAKGLAAFKEACEHDDANSCNRVASMYLSPPAGSAIKRDAPQAKTFLAKACDANFAPACHNLAVMYKKGDAGIPKDEAKYEEYRKKTENLIAQAGGMSSIKSA
ncbi:hypothetical protein BBJ28_00019935 [Nothophytophthora sp. Chile5]|nr:hypothetical protein BBJ28_00019935 [Nothophytophthora sp. Chile5]